MQNSPAIYQKLMIEMIGQALAVRAKDGAFAGYRSDKATSKLAVSAARFGLDSTPGGGQVGGGCPRTDLRTGWNFLRNSRKFS
jgi:hypothetical protein